MMSTPEQKRSGTLRLCIAGGALGAPRTTSALEQALVVTSCVIAGCQPCRFHAQRSNHAVLDFAEVAPQDRVKRWRLT